MTQAGLSLHSQDDTPFDAIKHVDSDGSEWWSARELMPLLGYDKWERFTDAIERAIAAITNTGEDAGQHASRIREAVSGTVTGTMRVNYRLTRYGAYMTVMNGDPRKPEIASGQRYFAVKTRQAEIAQQDTNPRHAIPQSFADALQLAADQARQIEQQAAAIAQRDQQLAIAAPKADAWDVLASTEGDLSVREAAHVLNRDPNISTGQGRLYAWLRDNGWVDRRDVPYAAHERHVRLRVYSHTDRDGIERDRQQVRITADGLRLLHRRLGDAQPFSQLLPEEPTQAIEGATR